MKRNALDKLQEISSKAKDTAARVLASEQASAAQIQAQRDQLKTYRDDYAHQLEAAKIEGADMMTIHTYSAFLSSLDAAYDAALTQVAKQQQRVVKSRESWVGAHRRATSFDALADRYDQEQSRAEARREARLQDEFNTNVAARASLLRN